MYKRPFLINCLIGTLILGSSAVSYGQQNVASEAQNDTAEKNALFDSIATDFSKKIIINSRDQELDGRNKISILIHNVVIKQGSLEIKADRVQIDASKGNGNEVITAIGSPATYKQRLEDGSMVTAAANRIAYDVSTRVLELVGDAKITQNQSMVSADAISYNMLEEKISANSDENGTTQVNTVISVGEQSDSAPADNSNNTSASDTAVSDATPAKGKDDSENTLESEEQEADVEEQDGNQP